MQIIIEPVAGSEIQLLTEVSRKTFFDSFSEFNTGEDMDLFLQKKLTTDTLESELLTADNAFFFAKINHEVVGYIKMSFSNAPAPLQTKDVLEIARLYAVKEKIGAGIGKALMEFAESFAVAQQRQTIWLGVWEHNQRAINFYHRFGFEKFGEHSFVLGTDVQTDWLMKKELT